jgi:nicotinamide riboside kinase
VGDGLRELGEEKKRAEMYGIFKNELERRSIPYVDVQGDWNERGRIVVKEITKLMR